MAMTIVLVDDIDAVQPALADGGELETSRGPATGDRGRRRAASVRAQRVSPRN